MWRSMAKRVPFSFQYMHCLAGLMFFSFFQGAYTLNRKILSGNHHIAELDSRAIQCKQAAYTTILTKLGKGHHVYVRVGIANAWLPYTNII